MPATLENLTTPDRNNGISPLPTGVLNGASAVFITSPPPNVTSYDVFLTKAGDVLIAMGVPTRTPVPGEPREFITQVDLTVVGGQANTPRRPGR